MSASNQPNSHDSVKMTLPVVVGIGSSAGGLEALKQLFKTLPDDTGVSFVLIQHLDPNHESLMADLLSNYTNMPVVQIREDTEVRSNHVYVIPPNKYLFLADATLKLSDPVERRGMRMAIDFFLRSLAVDMQEKSIAVILSGTGSDGSQGIKAIKEHGGMVMVQSPLSAQYDGMPRNAINTGVVDEVLDVEDMAATLVKYISHPYVNHAASTPLREEDEDYLQTILGILRARANYDFRCYKKGTLTRRIQRRMGLKQIDKSGDYVQYLRTQPDEVTQLFKDLLIGVTSFFRDEEAFRLLEDEVIDKLVEQAHNDEVLRVWVPGCASGEEAYSIGMVFMERLQARGSNVQLQMFASDIDEVALETARNGIYPESIASDVSTRRLEQFFEKVGEHYRVIKSLREAIVFASQNVVRDAPFSRLDLISCRNLLIYLKPEIQKKLFSLFNFALKPDGYLFLGGSETIGQQSGLFDTVNKKFRIYQRTGSRHPGGLEFPILSEQGRNILPSRANTQQLTSAALAQQALLEQFAPAAVLINRNDQILYYYGGTGEYLIQPTGEPTRNLIHMARDGVRTKLRSAVLKARRESCQVRIVADYKHTDGSRHQANIMVTPVLSASRPDEGLLLVAFVPVTVTEECTGEQRREGDLDENVVYQLEAELAGTREDLQSTIEELESSNEELKASNEEVMSMNEELQSTNEELETSKEELQSVNEELNTVNNQLQDKVAELAAANDDLSNLFSSTDLATLFLDTRFRIKRFTPYTTRLFKLIPSDIGRSVEDIATTVVDSNLLEDTRRVLDKLETIEHEIHTVQGQWFLQRVVPYRTQDNRIDGVLITWTDVTQLKQAQSELETVNNGLEELVDKRAGYATLLRDVAQIANHADVIKPAFASIINCLCDVLGWPVAHAYMLVMDEEKHVSHAGIWSAHAATLFDELVQVTGELSLGSDKYITGRVFREKQLYWLTAEEFEASCTRCDVLKKLGLNTLVVFPVLVGREAVATIELFHTQLLEQEPELLEMLEQVGTELGRVVERVRNQQLVKESEERFRHMSDHSPAFIWLCDETGKSLWFNRRWLDFTGRTLEQELQDDWMQLIHPDDRGGFIKSFEQALSNQEGFEIEWRLHQHGNGYHWLLGRAVPRATQANRFLGYIVTCIDITARKAAEERSLRHLAELTHLGRIAIAGELASGLAHEINQPLAAISNYARGIRRLLEQGVVDKDKLIPVFDKLGEQSIRAGEIIQRLRSFIKKGTPSKAKISINQLIQDTSQLWLSESKLGDIKICYQLEKNLPDISVDTIQIQQVLLNLVRNAIDAMMESKGEPRELVVQTRQQPSGNIEIIVKDSGPGMPEETLKRLFEPFFTTKREGMGLGVSISKTIIEAHGGTLSAHPNPDQGMSFHIELPV